MRSGETWNVSERDADTLIRACWFTSIGQFCEGYLTSGDYRIGTRQDVCGRGIGVSLIAKGSGNLYYVAEVSIPHGFKG